MEPVTDAAEPVTLTQGRTPPRDVGTSPTGPSIGSALDRLEAQLRSGGMPVAGQVDRLGGQPAGSAPGAEGEGSSVPTAPVGPVGPVGPDGAGAAPGRGVPTPQVTPVAPERFHTVKDGETLFQITKKYYGDGNRWKKLMEANPGRVGKNGEVRPGVRIMLPANEVITGKPAPASVAGNTGTARTVTTPTPTPTPTVPPTGPARTSAGAADRTPGNAVVPAPSPATSRTYTVVAGDTLSEISRKTLGTSKRADEIFALNKLKDRNSIFVGMKLVLPEK
jgi:nucleoid-associated protein YgaU